MANDRSFVTVIGDYLKDKPMPLLVLTLSSIFIVFSIIYDGRFFREAFLTFIYSLGATFLIQLRKWDSDVIKRRMDQEVWVYILFFAFWGWFILYLYVVALPIV